MGKHEKVFPEEYSISFIHASMCVHNFYVHFFIFKHFILIFTEKKTEQLHEIYYWMIFVWFYSKCICNGVNTYRILHRMCRT